MNPQGLPKSSSKNFQKKQHGLIREETATGQHISKCLDLLKSGELHLIDFDKMSQSFLQKPQAGDILQFELHNYCKKNMNTEIQVSFVIKLANLCYSKSSVLYFKSMDRFVGCVYYISSYLLKQRHYESALDVGLSLEIKKYELLQATQNSPEILNFLCKLHNSFMSSAILLVSQPNDNVYEKYKVAHSLAVLSLEFFQFISIENLEAAEKVLKTSKHYLQSIQHHESEDIIKFYNILKYILKTLYPKFCHGDFCMYYLFNLNRLNMDYSKGMETYVHLKRIIKVFLILADFSLTTKNNLEALLDLFFFEPKMNSSISSVIKNSCQCLDRNKELYFLTVSSIFHHGIQFWWNIFKDDWNKKFFFQTIQILIDKMLDFYKQFFRNSSFYCAAEKNPYAICFGDLLTGNLQKIQYTIRQCLKNKVPNSVSLISLSREAFKISVECIEVMNRRCCEKQRSYAWKFAVIHQTNLVEDITRYPPSEENWICLIDCCKDLIYQIVNSTFELPYDLTRIKILFQRWHQGVLKTKKFYDALFVCIVLYVSYPTEEYDVMSMWLQTKSECENEIIQEMTIGNMLTSCKSAIKEFVLKYDSSKINMKSVLLMEMKAYGFSLENSVKNEKTSYNLKKNILRQLEKMNLDIWERALTYICFLSSNSSEENIQFPNELITKCNEVVKSLQCKTSNGNPQCRNYMYAANLRFCLFLYNVRHSEYSEGNMDGAEMVLNYLKKAEEEKAKFGEDIDLNLTCDVIPLSNRLTIELETKYINDLDDIVKLCKNALESGSDDLPTTEEFEFWLQNVKLVAYLFELFGEFNRSWSAWLLFYKIGKLQNSSSAILLGLTHIMKSCSDLDQSELMKESEKIMANLHSDNKVNDLQGTYWLTVASNSLKNKQPKKCAEQLSKAKEVLDSAKTTTDLYILSAKFWCLVSQFLALYPDYEMDFGYSSGTDLRVIVFKAFNFISSGAKTHITYTATQVTCTELVLTLLEVSLWAFHFYEIYWQTDLMRFFLADLYQIVQKLVLPTRIAEILIRLAEVDLISEKISDCREKVNKSKAILVKLQTNSIEEVKAENYESPLKFTENDWEKPFRAISPSRFSDKSMEARIKDPSPMRYYLTHSKADKVKAHSLKCKCRPCQNFLIQILTMTTLSLEAEIFKTEDCLKKATEHYSEACDILSKLKHLIAEKREILQADVKDCLLIDPGNLDFFDKLLRFYSARFLIKYAVFELSLTNAVTNNINNVIVKIKAYMKDFSYERKLLMWKFGELELLWLVLTETKKKKKTVRQSTPEPYENTTVAKTPSYVGKIRTVDREKNRPEISRPSRSEESPVCLDKLNIKDTAFIDELPGERKPFINAKKLIFHSEDPETIKTVKKIPKKKNTVKAKKLDLDQVDN